MDPNVVAQYGFVGVLLLITLGAVAGIWKGVKWAGIRLLGDTNTQGIIPSFLNKQAVFMENVDSSVTKLEIATTTLANAIDDKLEIIQQQNREDIKEMWKEAREDRKQCREGLHELLLKFSPIVSYVEAQCHLQGIEPIKPDDLMPPTHKTETP